MPASRFPLRPPAPPDASPSESGMFARFQGLARRKAGRGLRRSVLEAAGQPPPLVGVRWGARFVRPLGAAAAVLLALLPLAVSGSTGEPVFVQQARACFAATGTTFRVYDDPTVSLFHGVETFDRLALASHDGPAQRR